MRIELPQRRLAQAALVLGQIVLVACGTSPSPTTGTASRSEMPAAVVIETSTAMATVKSIDYATRTLTVENTDGVIRTYQVDKSVVNFDQIHKGDRIRATVTDALAVSVQKASVRSNKSSRSRLTPAQRWPHALIPRKKLRND